MGFLTSPANIPFAVALAVVFLLGVMELLFLLMGGASSLFDGGSTDFDLAHGDVGHAVATGVDGHALEGHVDGAHLDADYDGSLVSQIFSWLHVGQIPSTILLIVFLLVFGSSGLILQAAIHSSFGTLLPAGWAVGAAFGMALPGTRVAGGLLKPLLPRDETEAVSRDSFVGCEAQITGGTARLGKPAEARLRDKFGRSHYILIEPDKDEEVFGPGSNVLVLKRRDAIYRGVQVSTAQLDD